MRRLFATLQVLALSLFLFMPLFSAPAPAATLDQEDLDAVQALVDKAVAKRLAPLRKELAEMNQEGITPTEIAGGIGYIIGLGGMFAYVASRRRKD